MSAEPRIYNKQDPINHKEFNKLLEDALDQEIQALLPNVQLLDPEQALFAISRAKVMHIPYKFMLPIPHTNGPSISVWYPKIFTNHKGMRDEFDGSGVILTLNEAYQFSMCDHEWDTSGANHSRGWHPQVCTKCGFNASIDSGD